MYPKSNDPLGLPISWGLGGHYVRLRSLMQGT